MALNIPTFALSSVAVTERNAQYAGTPFNDLNDGAYNGYLGCNRVGSCSPGIGIDTGNVNYLNGQPELPEKWTLLDQNGDTREPQQTYHIGGIAAAEVVGTPLTVQPIDVLHAQLVADDFNDSANFLAATQQAAPDAVVDLLSGAVNKTSVTVEIGDVGWFPVPTA